MGFECVDGSFGVIVEVNIWGGELVGEVPIIEHDVSKLFYGFVF